MSSYINQGSRSDVPSVPLMTTSSINIHMLANSNPCTPPDSRRGSSSSSHHSSNVFVNGYTPPTSSKHITNISVNNSATSLHRQNSTTSNTSSNHSGNVVINNHHNNHVYARQLSIDSQQSLNSSSASSVFVNGYTSNANLHSPPIPPPMGGNPMGGATSSSSSSSPPISPSQQFTKKYSIDENMSQDSAVGSSSHDDDRSVGSVSTNSGSDVSVGIEVDHHRSRGTPGYTRVVGITAADMVVLIKLYCNSESAASSTQVMTLLTDLARGAIETLSKRFKERLTRDDLLSMTLPSSSKTVGERVTEMDQELDSTVTVCEGVCRSTKMHGFVGFFIQDIAYKQQNCILGRSGVVVSLKRKNRYAPVEAFSDQLCEHILTTKPISLGSVELALQRQKEKELRVLSPVERDQLLPQTYVFDNTITVAEAARRSFVEITDFVFFD